jgi:hypothetical protein
MVNTRLIRLYVELISDQLEDLTSYSYVNDSCGMYPLLMTLGMYTLLMTRGMYPLLMIHVGCTLYLLILCTNANCICLTAVSDLIQEL